jgi:hypothetical protein
MARSSHAKAARVASCRVLAAPKAIRHDRAQSKKKAGDDYKLLATVPGNEAFQSLEVSRCPLVKK